MTNKKVFIALPILLINFFSHAQVSKNLSNLTDVDTLLQNKPNNNANIGLKNSPVQVYFNGINTLQQYHLKNPYGWNDGAMIPNRGYQIYASTGFLLKYKNLSVQLMPEVVWAENKTFDLFPIGDTSRPNATLLDAVYERTKSTSDLPERMGTSAYAKLNLGQSFVSYKLGKTQIALSNQNMWWGYSFRNSLLMTNNAPGFPHLKWETVKPITFLKGNWNFQIFSGIWKGSGINQNELYNINSGFKTSRTDNRYVNAMNIEYNPKWFNGFSVGFGRIFAMYESDRRALSNGVVKSLNLALPVFTGLLKNQLSYKEDSLKRDQKLSIYWRYKIPSEHFSIYGEFGREDHNGNITDVLQEPEHARAYLVGFDKLFMLSNNKKLLLQYEMTQVESTNTGAVRGGWRPSWYVHGQVTEGYTNKGQMIGAGVETGGNSQTLKLSYYHKNKYHFMVERWVHNNDLFYDSFNSDNGFDKHWVDMSFNAGIESKLMPKLNMRLNATLIRSYNYQWIQESRFNGSVTLGLNYNL